MNNREFFLERWKAEQPATVRVFRALPADKLDYRPHPRSRSARELVALLVHEVEGSIEMCHQGDINWNPPAGFGRLEEMIADYERHQKTLGERLRNVDEATWKKNVRLLVGGEPVHENTFEGMCWELLLDTVHHRGQLSVYIRPMGGKVPSIYGPSADDMGM